MTLQEYIDSVRNTPFKWGEHDCVTFAAKGLDAMHGTAYVARVKSFHVTSALAYRQLIRNAVSLDTLIIAELGAPASGTPRDGDPVLITISGRRLLGLSAWPLIMVAGPAGVIPAAPSADMIHWRIR